jgi:4-amino-4-deoxy-L-arabinose transferase
VLPYDYRYWNQNYVWLHKQPLALWVMADSIKLLGTTVFAVRLPSLLFSCLGVWLTYRIGCLLFTTRIGLLAALLHTTNGYLLEAASGRVATDHVDTLFVVLVEAGVYAALCHLRSHSRLSLLFTGLLCGLAVLTKWLTGLLPLAVLAAGLLYYRVALRELIGKLALSALLVALVALPWQLYILHAFPTEATFEYRYNSRHLWEALEGHAGGPLWHLNKLRIVFGETVFIALGLIGYRLLQKRDWSLLALTVYLLLPLLFVSLVATKMVGYLAVAYPAVFLLIAAAAHRLLRAPGKLRTVLAIFLLLLPLRYGIERMKLFERGARTQVQCPPQDPDNRILVIFGDPRPIRTMFHCNGVVAYSGQPSPEQIATIDTTQARVEGLRPE